MQVLYQRAWNFGSLWLLSARSPDLQRLVALLQNHCGMRSLFVFMIVFVLSCTTAPFEEVEALRQGSSGAGAPPHGDECYCPVSLEEAAEVTGLVDNCAVATTDLECTSAQCFVQKGLDAPYEPRGCQGITVLPPPEPEPYDPPGFGCECGYDETDVAILSDGCKYADPYSCSANHCEVETASGEIKHRACSGEVFDTWDPPWDEVLPPPVPNEWLPCGCAVEPGDYIVANECEGALSEGSCESLGCKVSRPGGAILSRPCVASGIPYPDPSPPSALTLCQCPSSDPAAIWEDDCGQIEDEDMWMCAAFTCRVMVDDPANPDISVIETRVCGEVGVD